MVDWSSEAELFALARKELFTAVVGDVMDGIGLRRQFLPPQVQPLAADMVVIGRAMPVLEADIEGEPAAGGGQFGLMFEALDDLREQEVYVCTGASPTYALWGELMSRRAIKLKAAGAVLNGYCRDSRGIMALNFSTFAFGSYAQDQAPRGKVVDYRLAVQIGDVRIEPADIVFGDRDGVCVIPRRYEEEVFAKAVEKVRGEHLVARAIECGMSSAEAFRKFGIM
jgi:4-hydroxy-4-methyl-2-oxoglutarate aldolase